VNCDKERINWCKGELGLTNTRAVLMKVVSHQTSDDSREKQIELMDPNIARTHFHFSSPFF